MKKLLQSTAALIAAALIVSCATAPAWLTSVSSKIMAGLAWAQTPAGSALVGEVAAGAADFLNGGGNKSQALAANIATAARSLETGTAPTLDQITQAVQTYTGVSSTATRLVAAIKAASAAAPTSIGGLEASAQSLDELSVLPVK